MPKTFVQVSEQEIKSRAEQESFPAPNYSANVLTDVFEDAKRLFLDYMIEVDYAHAVMLAEQGIITRDEAHSLFVALDGLDRDSLRTRRYDGKCEDLFFYIQSLITAACGDDIAGRLHTARSRNDIDVSIYRMRLREDALVLIRAALNLRREMLNIVERHHESVMPAYTHTQPAQPTTLAHYLLAMAEVLGRDIVRLRRAFAGINYSPLGACAITTSGFPIDRARTAELLGFDAPTTNSYASIGGIDYFTEMLASTSVMLINVGRFVQDFCCWRCRSLTASDSPMATFRRPVSCRKTQPSGPNTSAFLPVKPWARQPAFSSARITRPSETSTTLKMIYSRSSPTHCAMQRARSLFCSRAVDGHVQH